MTGQTGIVGLSSSAAREQQNAWLSLIGLSFSIGVIAYFLSVTMTFIITKPAVGQFDWL
jgi:hypothetical protein